MPDKTVERVKLVIPEESGMGRGAGLLFSVKAL